MLGLPSISSIESEVAVFGHWPGAFVEYTSPNPAAPAIILQPLSQPALITLLTAPGITNQPRETVI